MDLTNKILLFVLIVLKESSTTLTTDPEPEHEYDITNHLNEAIVKVFQSVNPSSSIRLVSRLRNNGKGKYDCHNTHRVRPFLNKIHFRNINISVWEPQSSPKIVCDFKANKVRIFNDDLIFNVIGTLDSSYHKPHASFKTKAKFKDTTIAIAETRNKPFHNKLQINFAYSHLTYNLLTIPWLNEKCSYKEKETLIRKVRNEIQWMIQNHISNNEKFLYVVRSSFFYRPMQNVVKTYPSVLVDEEHHFYSLPRVTFYGVNLVNLKIKGLTNFESLKPNSTFGNSSYTLVVKKVRGNMNLDNKEFQNFKFYEMCFNIESLFITVDFETKRLVVEARNYAVMQTSTTPQRESVFSTHIMHSIELAIADKLMPALEEPVPSELDDESFNHESETSVEETTLELSSKSYSRIRTTKSSPTPQITTQKSPNSERKTNKQSSETFESSSRESPKLRILTLRPPRLNNKSTESSQDEASSSEDTLTESSEDTDSTIRNTLAKKNNEAETKPIEPVKEDPYDYDITFHDVGIKLMPGSPYPKQIQCDLFKGLKIDYHVNAIPGGNIQLGNNGKSININFHANFTDIKISVEKQTNGTKENETCQFQIYSNQDIKVISPPKKNTTESNDKLKTKQEITQSAKSMMKESFIRTVKPFICLPLDFCSQSVQILEDFFQSFIDKILTKCSLQRNTTLTT